MKAYNKIIRAALPILSIMVFSSCAAGAATAGYALKAQTADSLTAAGEQRIVDRVKREIMAELSAPPCTNP